MTLQNMPLPKMKRSHIFTIAALSAVVALPLGVMAAHHGGGHSGHHGMMMDADTDGDGNISAAELAAKRAEKFKAADSNGDGVLTMKEFEKHTEKMREERRQKQLERKFNKMDTNGDGKIDASEHDAMAQKMFDRMDRDGDGTWTPGEGRHGGGKGWGRHGGHGPCGPQPGAESGADG